AQGRESVEDRLGGFFERNPRFNFGDQGNVGVILVKLVEPEDAPAQFIIAKERREVAANSRDEAVINRDRNVVAEQRRFESGGIITCPSPENVRFDRVSQRGGERKLVVLEFVVELVKGALSQFVVAFDEKRAERALSERLLFTLVVDQHAKLHVDVGQLRECFVVAVERGVAEGQEALFRLR